MGHLFASYRCLTRANAVSLENIFQNVHCHSKSPILIFQSSSCVRRKQATCDGPREKPLQQRTEGENVTEAKKDVRTQLIKKAILGSSVKSPEKNQDRIEALVRNYKSSKVEIGGGQDKSKHQSYVDTQKEVDNCQEKNTSERDEQEQMQEINFKMSLVDGEIDPEL